MLKFNLFSKAFLVMAIASLAIFSHAENAPSTIDYTPFSQMKMKKAPAISYNLSGQCGDEQQLTVVTGMKIDKQGKVMKTLLLKSSGNKDLDKKVIKQLEKAEFYPFMKNGIPTVVNLKLPIIFKCYS